MEAAIQLYSSVLSPSIDHIHVFGTLKTNIPLEMVSLISKQKHNLEGKRAHPVFSQEAPPLHNSLFVAVEPLNHIQS